MVVSDDGTETFAYGGLIMNGYDLFTPQRKKPREFWEPEQYRDFFVGGATPAYQPTPMGAPPPAPYQTPPLDVPELQEQALAPLRGEYQRALTGLESRLSKRGMGRSGALGAGEADLLREYLTRAGAVSGDITMRAAELGLSKEQLELQRQLGFGELGLKERALSQEDRQFEKQMELQWAEQGLNRLGFGMVYFKP